MNSSATMRFFDQTFSRENASNGPDNGPIKLIRSTKLSYKVLLADKTICKNINRMQLTNVKLSE